MMPDSVDDMFLGCLNKTIDRVVKNYAGKELKTFAKAWKQAANKANQNRDKAPAHLTKEQLQAVYVYTGPLVYQQFNTAVRTQRSEYGRNFQFHYLYVLLTSAVQTLKLRQPCYTTYRRCNVLFSGEVGRRMRFGSFASTSLKTGVTKFGRKTCFEISTCYGAYVGQYSGMLDEEEVLVPPYEVFQVSRKLTGDKDKPAGLEDCEVVFVVKSVDRKSELNCKLVAQ